MASISARTATRFMWASPIRGKSGLTGSTARGCSRRRLVKRFADFDIDGLRTDTDGNLFVARILKGTVAELSPQGKLKREIQLTAPEPTNLAFGGTDGKTIFVTQRKGGFVELFRTDHPGREFCLRACPGRR